MQIELSFDVHYLVHWSLFTMLRTKTTHLESYLPTNAKFVFQVN